MKNILSLTLLSGLFLYSVDVQASDEDNADNDIAPQFLMQFANLSAQDRASMMHLMSQIDAEQKNGGKAVDSKVGNAQEDSQAENANDQDSQEDTGSDQDNQGDESSDDTSHHKKKDGGVLSKLSGLASTGKSLVGSVKELSEKRPTVGDVLDKGGSLLGQGHSLSDTLKSVPGGDILSGINPLAGYTARKAGQINTGNPVNDMLYVASGQVGRDITRDVVNGAMDKGANMLDSMTGGALHADALAERGEKIVSGFTQSGLIGALGGVVSGGGGKKGKKNGGGDILSQGENMVSGLTGGLLGGGDKKDKKDKKNKKGKKDKKSDGDDSMSQGENMVSGLTGGLLGGGSGGDIMSQGENMVSGLTGGLLKGGGGDIMSQGENMVSGLTGGLLGGGGGKKGKKGKKSGGGDIMSQGENMVSGLTGGLLGGGSGKKSKKKKDPVSKVKGLFGL